MQKWIKTVCALLLLPVCIGAGETILRLIRESGHAESVWVALIAGIACWLVIYFSLPKPMWVYVVGHELTHVLGTWFFGGKVKRFKASARGGHVVVTKSNWVIALAPYFLPLYALLVVSLFGVGDWLWGWREYAVWFHLLLGASYAFHVTLTWSVLQTKQSDITDQGYLFAAVVIWLGNAGVLLLAIPLLTGHVEVWTALGWCWCETGDLLRSIGAWFGAGGARVLGLGIRS